MRENIVATVTTREVISAFNALSRIGELKPKNIAQSIRIAQNIRVLQMENRTIDAQREVIVRTFPAVKSIPIPGGGTAFQIAPEGWDREDPGSNSPELRQEARDISDAFSEAMKELDEAEIEVELRGLRVGKDLPEDILPNDVANCYWLITDFDEDPEPEKDDKKPRRPSKSKEPEE